MYDFIAIDFETAAIYMNSACSIGIACVSNFEIVDKKYFLIQPPDNKYDIHNTEIHGLTAADTESAPTFAGIWPEIHDLFGNCIVVAHNARFDMSVLYKCLQYYNIEAPDFQYIDSIAISNHEIDDKTIGKSLEVRANYFGIVLENHHNALSDAIACAEIVIKSVKNTNRKSLRTYCSSYRTRTMHLFSELKPMEKLPDSVKYKSIPKISDIHKTTSLDNSEHPFYKKNIVLTGELENLTRSSAMQKIVDVGGILKSTVSSSVHYLVVGKQNPSIVDQSGMSGKEKKAHDLIEKGIDIKIINEEEFLNLL